MAIKAPSYSLFGCSSFICQLRLFMRSIRWFRPDLISCQTWAPNQGLQKLFQYWVCARLDHPQLEADEQSLIESWWDSKRYLRSSWPYTPLDCRCLQGECSLSSSILSFHLSNREWTGKILFESHLHKQWCLSLGETASKSCWRHVHRFGPFLAQRCWKFLQLSRVYFLVFHMHKWESLKLSCPRHSKLSAQ